MSSSLGSLGLHRPSIRQAGPGNNPSQRAFVPAGIKLRYFHRNSVLAGDFDALRRGDEVYYVEDMGDTGPTASKVRVRE
jgi:hypothetical protein